MWEKKPKLTKEILIASIGRGNNTFDALVADLPVSMSTIRTCIVKYGLESKIKKKNRTTAEIHEDLNEQYLELRRTKTPAEIRLQDFVSPNGIKMDPAAVYKWIEKCCPEYRKGRRQYTTRTE